MDKKVFFIKLQKRKRIRYETITIRTDQGIASTDRRIGSRQADTEYSDRYSRRESRHPNQKKVLAPTIERLQETQKRKKLRVGRVCKLLGYSSRQIYYKQRRRIEDAEARESNVLELVKAVHLEMRRLGVRKVHLDIEDELLERGIKCGRDKLFSILRKHDMLIKWKKNYRKTTDSYHRYHKYKNEIKEPEQVWVSDITYFRGGEKNGYLFLVTDAYSRKIMGWHLGYRMRVKDGLKALGMAMRNKIYEGNLIHHSDRGIQYCSTDYIRYTIN